MFRKRERRKGMAIVLPSAIIERSIYLRELVEELQSDSLELKHLLEEERKDKNRGG